MTRYGFRYDWYTAPIAFGLGLVPPLTYADVDGERIHVRLGPWFVLDAARDAVVDADVARGDLGLAPEIDVRANRDGAHMVVRTGKGALARIWFKAPQQGRLLFGPPRVRPRFAPLVLGQPVEVTGLALSVTDAAAFVDQITTA